MKMRVHASTDIGRVRQNNEDSFLVDENMGMFAVADGVGGIPGGDLASQTAMLTLERIVHDPTIEWNSAEWVEAMHREVRQAGSANSFKQTIATTITMVDLDPKGATLTHLGDSGAYRIRGGQIEKLSFDHTVETETMAKGLPVDRLGHYRFAITRYLGMDGPVEPQVKRFDIKPHDRFLLATDGLTDLVNPQDMLRESLATGDPETLLEKLRVLCFEKGAHDNITAISVFVDET
jgi:serine/threonine protein phosphatase PrpC